MYSNLLFEPEMLSMVSSVARKVFYMGFEGLVIFSIIFISYSVMAFIKYRGKEFGVYMTLGMTQKNLKRMVFYENIVTVGSSLIVGLLSGFVFSRIFYMAFSKVLKIEGLVFRIHYESILLTIGIFFIIFLFSSVLSKRTISKISVIEVIKSSAKKDMVKPRKYTGIVSFLLVVTALILLGNLKSKFSIEETLVTETLKWICPIIIVIGLYLFIGSSIESIKNILKRYPNIYNKNILLLNNLSHKLLSYRSMLFIVSLLIGSAIFLIQFSYNLYATIPTLTEKNYVSDIMFVQAKGYNKVTEVEVKNIIQKSGGKVEGYSTIEYIPVDEYKLIGKDRVSIFSTNKPIVSESMYNKHMNKNVNILPGEFMEILNPSSSSRGMERLPYESIITAHDNVIFQRMEQATVEFASVLRDDFDNIIKEYKHYTLKPNHIPFQWEPLAVHYYNSAYKSGGAYIVDDSDYENIKLTLTDRVEVYHKINLSENKDKYFNALISFLKDKNNLDDSYWNNRIYERIEYHDPVKQYINDLRPIYVEEAKLDPIQKFGTFFFVFFFVGALILISSGVVLYYKILTSIDEERERVFKMSKIGMTNKEIKKLISKELKILYFVPVFIGGFLGSYSISIVLSAQIVYDQIMVNTISMIVLYMVIQIIFYNSSKNKYLKEVMYKK
ncbi:MAG: ABC transporter permease [Anaeromicrobium sp.]|nr:ABC transporter permease [Anaeromicrobium sp.]